MPEKIMLLLQSFEFKNLPYAETFDKTLMFSVSFLRKLDEPDVMTFFLPYFMLPSKFFS